jgi:pyruvate,water dikinase
MIAAAFYPNEVLLRFSDFKTNEYASLLGGSIFEPKEENPMIGWRGASRYYDQNFEEAFALECKAVKKVREEMGMYNLQILIPFCRTPEEGRKVIDTMKKYGLEHHKVHDAREVAKKEEIDERLRVWVMAKIPSNILQLEEFAEILMDFQLDQMTNTTHHRSRSRFKTCHKYLK